MRNVADSILSELDYIPEVRGRKDRKIGIVGAGRIALRRQVPAYRHGGLTVAAVADISREALERAHTSYGIDQGYSDYRYLLDRKDIDVIDICTNTFPRKKITLDALSAGKHVLSEKPFARTVADAVEMVEAAKRAGVHLAIHQPTRWYYPCAVARELIEKGILADVFYIELRLHGDQDTSYYEDPVTRWHADLTDHIFVEWGAHYFDLIRWFASGETPTWVFAWGTDRGNEHFRSKMAVSATARFDSGICGSLSLNQATRFTGLPMDGMTFRIEGTEGVIAGDMATGLSFRSRVRGGIEATFDWGQRLPTSDDPGEYLWFASIRDGHLWPMAELLNAIDEERSALCSAEDNLETVRTYLAALRSDETGSPVDPRTVE